VARRASPPPAGEEVVVADRNERRGGGQSATDELGEEFQHLLSALADRVLSSANDRVGNVTDKLSGIAEGATSPAGRAITKAGEKTAEGKSPLMAGLSAGAEGIKSKVGDVFKGGKGGGKGGGKQLKVTNIIEQIDIGAPIELVYDQWTQFQDFSNFMKKVEGVNQEDEQKLSFKAQVLWSHRQWEATIVEQVPDSRIVWRSKGEKGRVDGAVTFHELAPELTRVLVVLEYYPQGLFERTGNLWRAQGRRVRLELKHFRRHVMAHALLHPDDVEGWRGEIHDSKVTKSDEEARQSEEESDESGDAEDEASDEQDEDFDDEDEGAEDEEEGAEDEAEPDYDDEDEDEGAEDESDYDEEGDEEGDEDEDEGAEDEADDGAEDESDEDAEDYDEDAEDESDEDDDERDEIARRRRSRQRPRARAGGGRR
jgi:uncharacterized membrane protein